MAKLQGFDELNTKINALLNKGLHTDITYTMGTDFCYLSTTETVYCSLFSMKKSDDLWKDFIERKFGLKLRDCEMWIFSILHEVGHYNTLFDVAEYQYKYSQLVKKIIERPLLGSTKLANDIYFGLPDEIVATAWAVAFFRKHKNLCWQLSEQAFGYIQEFYNLNDVKD